MIDALAKDQRWAHLAPVLAVLTGVALFSLYHPSQAMFWALVNIPLYLIHQTEEHLWPGGFKEYINTYVNKDPQGTETLTDRKVFWINILLVWLAFAVFGVLATIHLGFGLLIIIFSLINCATHIRQGLMDRRWNPGLVMASIQFAISVYAAIFVTSHGLTHAWEWWLGSILFSVVGHLLLFRFVMQRGRPAQGTVG